MGEVDPYRPHCLEDLRKSKLRPHTARMVLWSAGYRIIGDKDFSAQQRKYAGIYLETIMWVIDSTEKQEALFALEGPRTVPELLDMGNLMGWAFLEIHNATFRHMFDPSNRRHQKAAVHMQRTVGAIEDHVTDAYQQYMAYEAAQAQDPTQTDVKWC